MYDLSEITEICLSKIKNNRYRTILYASPSYNPPYRYYWIRDAAIVYKSIIDMYQYSKRDSLFVFIINYIETETKIQNIKTIGGLGEPKVNLDLTAFNGSWGRPQNDGPAVRGINMIKLYNLLFKEHTSICLKIILPIIVKDIDYIVNNYNKPCFDLWEENYGWHFYTRAVQLKFIKDYIDLTKNYNIHYDKIKINTVYEELQESIKHHLDYSIISSFDENGTIIKKNDASILLALCHTDYDEIILNNIDINKFIKVSEELIHYFKNKYNNNNYNLIGRYENDAYYNGHIWIIFSLAVAQLYLFISKNYYKLGVDIVNYILSIDPNINLDEQYDIDSERQLSAKNLTWNYSELYFSYKLINPTV